VPALGTLLPDGPIEVDFHKLRVSPTHFSFRSMDAYMIIWNHGISKDPLTERSGMCCMNTHARMMCVLACTPLERYDETTLTNSTKMMSNSKVSSSPTTKNDSSGKRGISKCRMCKGDIVTFGSSALL
jgi:hypothetical protein